MSESYFLTCPHCGKDSQYGISVCSGCQAEVLYRVTSKELLIGFLGGGVVGFIFPVVVIHYVSLYFNGLNDFWAELSMFFLFICFIIFPIFGVFIMIRRGRGVRFIRNYKYH